MEISHVLLLATLVLSWYCVGAMSVLTYVAHQWNKLLEGDDKAPTSRTWLVVVQIPALITCLLMLSLFFKHPDTCPMGMIYLTALIAIGILYRTYQTFGSTDDTKLHQNAWAAYMRFSMKKDKVLLALWVLAGLVLSFVVFETMVS